MRKIWTLAFVVIALIPTEIAPAAEKTARVLFVGNSLTYFNSLPELTAAVAASLHPAMNMQVEMLAAPGATIRQHLDTGHLAEILADGRFDVVVFQELGGFPLCDADFPRCAESPAALAQAVQLIKASRARPILLGTYAPTEQQPLLSEASVSAATELRVDLVDWGAAIKATAELHPDLLLIGADQHPLPLASWLAAMQLAAHISGQALPKHASQAACAPNWTHATPAISNSRLASKQPPPAVKCLKLSDSTYLLLKRVVTRH